MCVRLKWVLCFGHFAAVEIGRRQRFLAASTAAAEIAILVTTPTTTTTTTTVITFNCPNEYKCTMFGPISDRRSTIAYASTEHNCYTKAMYNIIWALWRWWRLSLCVCVCTRYFLYSFPTVVDMNNKWRGKEIFENTLKIHHRRKKRKKNVRRGKYFFSSLGHQNSFYTGLVMVRAQENVRCDVQKYVETERKRGWSKLTRTQSWNEAQLCSYEILSSAASAAAFQ